MNDPFANKVAPAWQGPSPSGAACKGHLSGMKAGDLVHALLPQTPLDLELQDARHAQISLKNLDGDFDATGLIAPTRAKGA